MVASSASIPGHNGRPMLRERPADFEAVFIEIGRLDCEGHYRARRDTITRWLIECGKKRLIRARAEHVAKLRAKGEWLTRSTRMVEHREIPRLAVRESIRDRRKVSDATARHAAQFLRVVRNGGFIVSPASDGSWWVGSRRLSAAQMVDLAKAKGYAPLQLPDGGEVKR